MHKESVKQSFVDYIRENGSITYSEIEEVMTAAGYDWRGSLCTCSDVNPNVVFWEGWNADMFSIIGEMITSGTISREPCHWTKETLIKPNLTRSNEGTLGSKFGALRVNQRVLNYLVGGKCLNLPLVKRYTEYKTEHWLPCVFVLCKGERQNN